MHRRRHVSMIVGHSIAGSLGPEVPQRGPGAAEPCPGRKSRDEVTQKLIPPEAEASLSTCVLVK